MIDWVSARVPFPNDGTIGAGDFLSTDSNGVLEYCSRKKAKITGSYDSHIYIRSFGTGHVDIHGNPAKFLQGHNLFGTDDLQGLVHGTMVKILKSLGYSISRADEYKWLSGDFTVSRVDCTFNYRLSDDREVEAWIRGAESSASLRYRGRGVMTSGTLYFGKHSRRWSLKFYSKGRELQAGKEHRLQGGQYETKLKEYASGLLRAEVVVRQLELKTLGLHYGHAWTEETVRELHVAKLAGLEMSEKYRLPNDEIEELPPRLKAVYQLWQEGHDLRTIYPRATYYRYRRELKDHGVDILSDPPNLKKNNVIPLIRVIQAEPANIPFWAPGSGFYYEPQIAV
jgi:II/X family phage/plasmid replication protein